MAQSLHQLSEALASNIRQLAAEKEAEREKMRKLKAENDDLRKEIAERDDEIERLQQENDFLALSYRLADSPDKLVDARRLIARLIRTIDVCIALLKE